MTKKLSILLSLLISFAAFAQTVPAFDAWNRSADDTHLFLLRSTGEKQFLDLYDVQDPSGKKDARHSLLQIDSTEQLNGTLTVRGVIKASNFRELVEKSYVLELRIGGNSRLVVIDFDGKTVREISLPKSQLN